MSDDRHFRPAHRDDMRDAFAVFRRSLYDYLYRTGQVTAEEAADPPIKSVWIRQASWIEHLWDTAAENWVATDDAGRVVGWALSVLRATHLELAFFFVDPGDRTRGTGRRLLEHAFEHRPETSRSIVATQDPPALSLYLRAGVRFATTSCDISVRARPRGRSTDLAMHRLAGPDDIATIARMEERLIGLRRAVDLGFLERNRPGWIALRRGEPVGYAFGAPPPAGDRQPGGGPIGALDPADVPHLIDHVLAEAPDGSELSLTVPMANATAVSHLLALGGKIDPFYVTVLTSHEDMALDRYIHTSPCFIL